MRLVDLAVQAVCAVVTGPGTQNRMEKKPEWVVAQKHESMSIKIRYSLIKQIVFFFPYLTFKLINGTI
jgi:hypothetical protein